MATLGFRPYRLLVLAVISISRIFCLIHASTIAFAAATGALFLRFPVDPRAIFAVERLWRTDLQMRRTPAYARVVSFLCSIAQRHVTRRLGPPLNAGLASCSLA